MCRVVKTDGLQYKRPKAVYIEEHRREASTKVMERTFDIVPSGPIREWAERCEKQKTFDELPKHRGNHLNRH